MAVDFFDGFLDDFFDRFPEDFFADLLDDFFVAFFFAIPPSCPD